MKPYHAGVLLRLLGPLIEMVSVVGFVRYRGQGARVMGVPVETLCMVGFGVGLVLVVLGLGLTLFRSKPKRPQPSGRFGLDLGPDGPAHPRPSFDDDPEPESEPESDPDLDPWRELR